MNRLTAELREQTQQSAKLGAGRKSGADPQLGPSPPDHSTWGVELKSGVPAACGGVATLRNC